MQQAYSEAFDSVNSDLIHARARLSTTTQTKVARAKALQVRSKDHHSMPTSRGDSPSDAIDGDQEEEVKADKGGAQAKVVTLQQQVHALEQNVLEVHIES